MRRARCKCHVIAPAPFDAWIGSLASRPRILLAEDNATNRLVVHRLLGKHAIDIVTVDDGAAAVIQARQSHFDMILMDMQMPVMDGLTAARTLRAKGARLPIVALTANAYPEDIAACKESGMSDFVAKPVTGEALRSAIRRALDRVPAAA